ncbi:MAG: redoxin domain-containing protein [Nitratireductor sp.]
MSPHRHRRLRSAARTAGAPVRFLSLIILALMTLAIAVAIVSRPAAASPRVDAPAPGFTATDSNGKTVSLDSFQGRTVVLEWSNHDCPYVRKHYETGNMQRLQRSATDEDVVWLTVISSAPGKQGHVSSDMANELTAERGAYPSAVLLDPEGEIGRAYDARTTPHMFVIRPDGKLAYMGAIDDRPTADKGDVPGATNYVTAALEAVDAGAAPDPAATKPYGCSVKY